ncbi:MAG: hypothetical protein PVH06_07085, partial [Methyloceanibacter sp.]
LENRTSANDPCDRSTRHHALQKFDRPSQNKGAVSLTAGGSELYLVLLLDCLFDDTLTILVVGQRRSGCLPRVIPLIGANPLHAS